MGVRGRMGGMTTRLTSHCNGFYSNRSRGIAWNCRLVLSSSSSSLSSSSPMFSTASTTHESAASSERRRLDVAIVGLPNAGKSQLLNVLCAPPPPSPSPSKSQQDDKYDSDDEAPSSHSSFSSVSSSSRTNHNSDHIPAIAAVSRKRHTTRRSGVLGAYTDTNTATQLVFADTPGFLRPADAARMERKGSGLSQDLEWDDRVPCDYTLVVVDAARKLTYSETLVQLLLQAGQTQGRVELVSASSEHESDTTTTTTAAAAPETVVVPPGASPSRFAIVLNKVDLVHPKDKLMDLAVDIEALADATLRQLAQDDDIDVDIDESNILDHMPMFFYVSAINPRDAGLADLRNFLLQQATPTQTEWEVNPLRQTNLEPLEQVEEIIREKIYRCLHKEVPYHIRQSNRLFRTGVSSQAAESPQHERPPKSAARQTETQQQTQTQIPTLLIHQDLLVRTASHQKLLLQSLERIRASAERDLARNFHCRVLLQLHVKLPRSKNKRWSI